MNYHVLGRQSFMFSTAGAHLKRPQCARGWPAALLALILVAAWNWSAARADDLDVDFSNAKVGGQVPITSQFLPEVVWINFYVDGQYAASAGESFGTFNWDSTTVADGIHDISAMGFDAPGVVSGYSDIRLTVANSNPITPAGAMAISGYADQYISWTNLYVDGSYAQSSNSGYWGLSQSFTQGTHQIQVTGYRGNDYLMASAEVGNITFGATGSSTTWSVTPGATISSLTGSAAGLPWADTNPAHYGQYWAWGDGYPLIGGPLLNDSQAASFVKSTPKSAVELSISCSACGIYEPDGAANAADNNYFNYMASNNPSGYLSQLEASDGFYAAYSGSSWQPVADRIDGACPIANPTTAEVLQWAANKWGINPLLLYAGAAGESEWDQTAAGDNGTSGGLFMVADRGAYHAFPGFGGLGSMLARENTCFNADFYAAYIYSAFNGLLTGVPGGDIGTAIQSWASNPATSAGAYTEYIY